MISATKTCKCCGEEKPSSMFYRGRAKCKPCLAVQYASYREVNKEAVAERKRKYASANKDSIRARQAEWMKRNAEHLRAKSVERYREKRDIILEQQAKWRRENPERRGAITSRWMKSNPEKQNALTAKRRAMKLMATAAWGDSFVISEMYDLAKRRTRSTGVSWHVDHIVPLRSKIVCGLHVHTNMRVIPGSTNMAKSNRVWPEMPL